MDNVDLIAKWQFLYNLYDSNESEKILKDGISVENALGYIDGPCKYSYFHAQQKLILARQQLQEISYNSTKN